MSPGYPGVLVGKPVWRPFYFKRREKLKHLILGMVRLERITIEVRGIARALYDLEDTLEFNSV